MSEKTHAEIIAEQLTNIESLGDELPAIIAAGSLRKLLRHLDKAHECEVDALKQRINELDAEVAAKDEVIKRLNDAIAEEQRRKMVTTENPSAVGNSAKLREALEFAEDELWAHGLFDASKRIASALAASPRNCDIGSAVEQNKRFVEYCKNQRIKITGHADACNPKCPCRKGGDLNLCALAWAQMHCNESEATDGER